MSVSVTRLRFYGDEQRNRQPDDVTVSDDSQCQRNLCWSFGTRATCVLTTDYTVTAADVTAG
jgi:hypothetical protein